MTYSRRRRLREVDSPIRQKPKHLMPIFWLEPKDSPLIGAAIPACILVAVGPKESWLTLTHRGFRDSEP